MNSSANTKIPQDDKPKAEPSASNQADPALAKLTVDQRLAYLREQFTPSPAAKTAAPTPIKKGTAQSVVVRRLIKSAAALAVAIGVVWVPAQRLLQTTSVEAVVNARLVTLRSPIDGVVSSTPANLVVGADIASGAPLLKISNSRADRTRLDDLRRLVEHAEAERKSLTTRLDSIKAMHADFVAQTQLFQKGRIQQLEARIEENRSDLEAANLRQQEAAATLQRAVTLNNQNSLPQAQLERAQRDNEIARQQARSLEYRIKGAMVELDAARTGTFLGDSYNDRPRSSQRADELWQQIVELSAQADEKEAALRQQRDDLAVEQTRYDLAAEASVLAASGGTIWELLTAPGEQVQRGQDLVRMLDCKAALVTAVVSESVYNRLQVGSSATFRFRDGDQPMPARIVNLTGVAAAPANFAIAPSSLSKEAYRVVVSVPDLAKDAQGCNLGRTGQVVFGDRAIPPAAASPQR